MSFILECFIVELITFVSICRYTCSMQLEIKQREKMKRRRTLQMILFLKVSVVIGFVASCGVASRAWKLPFLWAIFCTVHSLQVKNTWQSFACLWPYPLTPLTLSLTRNRNNISDSTSFCIPTFQTENWYKNTIFLFRFKQIRTINK